MMILLSLASALAGPLPPPDFPHGGSEAHAEAESRFGADLSVGFAHGLISAPWIERGGFGALVGRYEAFARDRSTPGPRIGASIWASQTIGKQAYGSEPAANGEMKEIAVDMSHYGAMTVIRHSPDAPIGATMGFGFGRAEIDDYYGAPLALPVLSFEAGARHKAPHHTFVDWTVRAHWATARNAVNSEFDEWWMVQAVALFGIHAN